MTSRLIALGLIGIAAYGVENWPWYITASVALTGAGFHAFGRDW